MKPPSTARKPASARLTRPVLYLLATLWLVMSVTTAAPAIADPVRVVTTIKPIHALATQVLDGISQPKLLVDGTQSPHVFSLKPSDAAALNKADLFVRVSASLESFSEKIRAALPRSVTVLTLIDAKGLKLLPTRQSGKFEAHTHHDSGHEHADHGQTNHDAHHDHDKHGDHDDHATTIDPHIWLDPHNAQTIVRELAAALVKIAPEHKSTLEQNAAKAIQKLIKLELELDAKLAPVKATPFIVFHDAFHYFEHRFGLHAAGAITLHPEAPPSGKRLREIRKKIKTAKVRCVFSEPQFNAKRTATVVEGSGAQVGTLDPLGGAVTEGAAAYDTMMRNLADQFVSCLKR